MNGRENQLIHETGSMILSHVKFADDDWDSLSVVLKFRGSGRGGNGYKYARDRWIAAVPNGFDLTDKIVELKEAMAERTGEPWNWALPRIVAPDRITIDFSYDDENPWGLGAKSLDMHDYAMSLRSPEHPARSRVEGELPRGWNTPR